MSTHTRAHALSLHRRLPTETWEALYYLGLPDSVIHGSLIGWDGKHITVPVFGRKRVVRGFEVFELDEDGRLQVAPEETPRKPLLFGDHLISVATTEALLVEGVAEALVASAHGFNALSATGYGLGFDDEWIGLLGAVHSLAVCFKRTEESIKAALYVNSRLPGARIVSLPSEVGLGGGLQEFFDLGKHAEDLRSLIGPTQGGHA